MAEDGDKYGAVPDTPELKPEAIWPWLIAVAVFAGLVTVGLTLWVDVTNEKPSDKAELIRTYSPLFLGAGAAVTFMTVLWRGAINQQQVREDKRQNDTNENAEMASLLEKAVSFVETKEPQKMGVGLAMLETVAIGPNEEYALFALDVAFDQIAVNYGFPKTPSGRNLRQICRTFEQAYELQGRILGKRALDLSDIDWRRHGYPRRFEFHEKLPISYITGGVIVITTREDIKRYIENAEIRASRTRFIAGNFPNPLPTVKSVSSWGCKYEGFKLSCIDFASIGMHNKFVNCDVSDADIEADSIPEAAFENCFFYEDTPPRIRMACVGGGYTTFEDPYEIEAKYPFKIKEHMDELDF